jgi:hypothetical protein
MELVTELQDIEDQVYATKSFPNTFVMRAVYLLNCRLQPQNSSEDMNGRCGCWEILHVFA